jgi:hypothetical protein
MTIASVGYGDVAATPQEPWEAVIAIFLMLGLAFVWSNLIGIFCSVLSNMNPARQEFRLTMNALNDYVHKNNLPPEMAQRLRDFFHRTKHMWTTEVR